MKLSDKIRILRKARGFSQQSLWENLSRVREEGISRQSVSDWENGKTEPKLENIRDLAEVLNVSFDALLDESINLEDPDVLTTVLLNVDKDAKKDINNQFRYDISYTKISKKANISFIFSGITLLLLIIVILLGIYITPEYLVFLAIPVPQLLLVLFDIRKIKRMLNGEYNTHFLGYLNNTHIILYLGEKEVNNTIYLPIEKIEKIELTGKQRKTYGDIKIFIKGSTKQIDLKNVTFPNKLIEFFNSFESFIENQDEFKTL